MCLTTLPWDFMAILLRYFMYQIIQFHKTTFFCEKIVFCFVFVKRGPFATITTFYAASEWKRLPSSTERWLWKHINVIIFTNILECYQHSSALLRSSSFQLCLFLLLLPLVTLVVFLLTAFCRCCADTDRHVWHLSRRLVGFLLCQTSQLTTHLMSVPRCPDNHHHHHHHHHASNDKL